MKKLLFTLVALLAINIGITKGQETEELVEKLHACLSYKDFEQAQLVYAELNKITPAYVGYYTSTFDLYMSICISDLDISLGEGDIDKFFQMRTQNGKVSKQMEAKIISEIASTLCQYNIFDIAIKYYQKLLDLEEYIIPIYFYRYLMRIGFAYNAYRMPQKAYMSYKRCADYYKNKFGAYSINYAAAIHEMAYTAHFINIDNLNLLLTELDIHQHNGDTASTDYAVCLDNIATYYIGKNKLDSALYYALAANNILKKDTTNFIDNSISLNNLGAIYNRLTISDKTYIHKAEELFLQALENNPYNNYTLLNLALLYDNQLGDTEKGEEYIKNLSESSSHTNYAIDVANHYARIGDFEKYNLYMADYLNYIRRIQQINVPYMSEKERSSYINIIQNERMEDLFQFASQNRHSNLAALCYDYLLMSKSLLLSYDSNIEEIMKRIDDKELKDNYISLKVLKYNKQKDNSLLSKSDSLEHIFLDKLSKIANFTDFTNQKYTDVREKLGDTDVAIEFYESSHATTNKLYAVIISNDKQPKVICCRSTDKSDSPNSDKSLTLIIYDKIRPYIINKERLFFSPDGELYNYPFESELSLIRPSMEIYRLSSTREILRQTYKKGQGIVLFGGLQYDLDVEHLKDDARKYPSVSPTRDVSVTTKESLQRHLITGLSPLPGTLQEVENIYDITHTLSADTTEKYTKEKGTESAFKYLSGKNKRVIHIATHGFYDEKGSPATSDNSDLSMWRSGIFFAGADNFFYNDSLPENIDDGILNAQEIATLDLSGVDIVGLSACQTAQGLISKDGVFGLQRGFKKAGVNSILMSLWKVDDDATCALMTEFYKHWINGCTKVQALKKAKQKIRVQRDKGWDKPQYWAGFILLDAIN